MFHGAWEKAIATLKRHLALPSARWADERCASMRYIARCYRQLGKVAEAERWYLRAAAEAPHLREPWVELASLYYQQGDWEGTAFAAGRALAIHERTLTYISEGEAWGSLPYDLRALGLYYTSRKAEALPFARKAAELSHQSPAAGKCAADRERSGGVNQHTTLSCDVSVCLRYARLTGDSASAIVCMRRPPLRPPGNCSPASFRTVKLLFHNNAKARRP